MPMVTLALAALLAAPIEIAHDVGWVDYRAPAQVRTGDTLKITGVLANFGDFTESVWVEAHDLTTGETLGRSVITVVPYYQQRVVFRVETGGYATGIHRIALSARLHPEDDEPYDNIVEIDVGVFP